MGIFFLLYSHISLFWLRTKVNKKKGKENEMKILGYLRHSQTDVGRYGCCSFFFCGKVTRDEL